MLQPILVLHAPHLPPAERLRAADSIARSAAGRAVKLAQEVEALVGRIEALGDSLHDPGDALATLRTIVGVEAELLLLARCVSVYAGAAGSSCPAWVHERLEGLAGARA